MALTNMYFKTKLVSCFRGEERNRRERRRRRREEEEEGGGFKPRSSKPRYGTLDFWSGNYLDHGIEWIHGTLRLCMINIMSPNLGFSLNCILTLDFLKLRWVKPTRNKISKEFPF